MAEYLQINKYCIDINQLLSYSFLCDPNECIKANKCCCKIFEVEISRSEMYRIISIMDIISVFCPQIKNGKSYKNVFEEEDNLYIIDKLNNDYCVFSYFDYDGIPRCGIHSAALKINLNPYLYKPVVCSIWPLTVFKDSPQKSYIDLDIESKAPCLKKKKSKINGIDLEFLNTMRLLIGNGFEIKMFTCENC